VQARCQQVFEGLISTRQVDDWRISDITVAARLARLTILADIETLALEQEGTVTLTGGKNGDQPVRNPRNDALSAIHSQITTAHRALSLHGSPTDKREIHRAAKAQAQAKTIIQRVSADDLLA
jgi:hypothetical protein